MGLVISVTQVDIKGLDMLRSSKMNKTIKQQLDELGVQWQGGKTAEQLLAYRKRCSISKVFIDNVLRERFDISTQHNTQAS